MFRMIDEDLFAAPPGQSGPDAMAAASIPSSRPNFLDVLELIIRE
jgi:hypothetical protein